jgi:monoamine oxidase
MKEYDPDCSKEGLLMSGPLACSRVSRRQFLRHLGLMAGVALTTSLLNDLDALAKPKRPLHFVIVGAGLAGLCAAYELEQRGHTCILLEAETSHIGGRVRTVRFEDGLYGEAGAMRIPLRHELTRHYIKKFGLELRRFVHYNPEAYFYLRGHRERVKNVKQLNRLYDLKGIEREKTPDDLWADVVIRRLKALTDRETADLSSVTPETAAVRALDRRSLQQLFEADGLSPEAIEFLAVAYGLEPIMMNAATEYLREEREQVWMQEFHEIVGGTDRLPAAFASRLKSKPRLGCEVVRLEQDPSRKRAAAVYNEGGRQRRAEGDFVLCTLPFPVLGRLQIVPPFSEAKRRAVRELSYDSATKVLAVTNRRFWEADDQIFGGGTYTDLPTGMTYYPSDNAAVKDPAVSAGPGVMLASYTWGQAARRLATLPHPERSALVIRHLSQVHSQLNRQSILRHTVSWSWDSHRWSGGAFAWFTPGQHTSLHRHVISPEGRIFFAGEHTSLTHTWMQGALESALRAVREMLSDSGR